MTNLYALDVSENKLTSIPDSIAKLTNLVEVVLSYNPLREDKLSKVANLLPKNCAVYIAGLP